VFRFLALFSSLQERIGLDVDLEVAPVVTASQLSASPSSSMSRMSGTAAAAISWDIVVRRDPATILFETKESRNFLAAAPVVFIWVLDSEGWGGKFL